MHGATSRPPLVVVEGEAHAVTATRSELLGAGWAVIDAGAVAIASTDASGRVVELEVAGPAQATAALLLARTGHGLLVHGVADPPVLDTLLEDLRRLGRVHHRVPQHPQPDLAPSTWGLLHAVAAGETVAGAARAAHLSVRTAERRIAEGRKAVGAATAVVLSAVLQERERIPPAPPGGTAIRSGGPQPGPD